MLSELTLEVFFGLCVRGSQCFGAFSFGKKRVFFLRGEQLKTQKANLKILLHENKGFFFVPFVSDFFFGD